MKLFECIVDDGQDVFKTFVATQNKKELLSVYGGNGSFEKIKDVTKDYFTNTSVDFLRESLTKTGWGKGEIELITALLDEHIKKQNK